MVNHGHERQDDYYWMRLTDNQKTTKPYDEQTKKVIDYINAENEYTKEKLSDTKDLQNSFSMKWSVGSKKMIKLCHT